MNYLLQINLVSALNFQPQLPLLILQTTYYRVLIKVASLEQFSFEAFDTVDHVILVEELKNIGASSQGSS